MNECVLPKCSFTGVLPPFSGMVGWQYGRKAINKAVRMERTLPILPAAGGSTPCL